LGPRAKNDCFGFREADAIVGNGRSVAAGEFERPLGLIQLDFIVAVEITENSNRPAVSFIAKIQDASVQRHAPITTRTMRQARSAKFQEAFVQGENLAMAWLREFIPIQLGIVKRFFAERA